MSPLPQTGGLCGVDLPRGEAQSARAPSTSAKTTIPYRKRLAPPAKRGSGHIARRGLGRCVQCRPGAVWRVALAGFSAGGGPAPHSVAWNVDSRASECGRSMSRGGSQFLYMCDRAPVDRIDFRFAPVSWCCRISCSYFHSIDFAATAADDCFLRLAGT